MKHFFTFQSNAEKILILFLSCCGMVESNGQSFSSHVLESEPVYNPTSLQWGPDGKLYVSQLEGTIKVFTVQKENGGFKAVGTETIELVKNIPNHNDDGTYNPNVKTRQVTGILVKGTSDNPILYVSSSDSRMGGESKGIVDLDTNSGVISKLTKNGGGWEKVDLVRGLPRCQENHSLNGLQLDSQTNKLYAVIGGNTNAGSPSMMFAYTSEYAYSGAVISVDLNAIEAMSTKSDPTGQHPYKYDMPTLNDPDRPDNPDGTDINDPWGGNFGLNMAKIVPGGPVQIFASGFRNPYDLLITSDRRLFVTDNGANPSYGGTPVKDSQGNATNNYDPSEPGSTFPDGNGRQVNNLDAIHFIGHLDSYVPGSYYGGHPNPIRANPAGAGLYTYRGQVGSGTGVWRTSKSDPDYPLPSDWPPVPLDMAKPNHGEFLNPGEQDPAIITFPPSNNGICEYKSDYEGMLGSLLTTGYSVQGPIYNIRLKPGTGEVLNQMGDRKFHNDELFASGIGHPLGIVSMGDDEAFPGTVWVTSFSENKIYVYQPTGVVSLRPNETLPFKVNIFPNPTNNQVTINLQSEHHVKFDIQILNSLGKEQLKKSMQANAGNDSKNIDISGLSPGTYLIKISSQQKSEVFKVIKL